MNRKELSAAPAVLPGWVPEEARVYLTHVERGTAIREIARGEGRHASTVLRQIRRFENRRDDPLVDEALAHLGRVESVEAHPGSETCMVQNDIVDDETLKNEGRRVLRRLVESGAVMAVAEALDKAVVVREAEDGRSVRTATLERSLARAMALAGWIGCEQPKARIARYEITAAGRAALKRMLAEEGADDAAFEAHGLAERRAEWGERTVAEDGERRTVRYNLAESPLTVLARRKDAEGKPFLSDDLVAAGERLREDFELAQMAPSVTQNWDRFLTAGVRGTAPGDGSGTGSEAARRRVQQALAELGPGLGDVALRTCCFLEGIETAEKRMGWSARSGKIVLRIALQRLRLHYEQTHGRFAPKIG